jgi:hypothetical protein
MAGWRRRVVAAHATMLPHRRTNANHRLGSLVSGCCSEVETDDFFSFA